MSFTKYLSATVLTLLGFVLCVSAQAQRTATAVPTVANGFVIAVTLTDGGAGYTAAPTVTISGGGGNGAIAVATVHNGAVDKVIVQNAGNGYSGTPTVVISSPPSPNPPFSEGLIAYYPFNGNVNDASGNGINGVVHGATLTKDRFGNPNGAYYFDGTSAYITTPLTSAIFGGNFTASVWFNAYDLANGWPTLLWEQNESFSIGLGGDLCGCDSPRYLFTGCSYAPGTHSWLLSRRVRTPLNTDCQVVVTKVGTSVTMYWNGQVADTGQVTSPTMVAGQNLTIGQQDPLRNLDYTGFHGVIDDIRIYNRALSNDEVADLYSYESAQSASLTIEVKQVRVNMSVVLGKRYQLETSNNLSTWTAYGVPFVATSSKMSLDFDVITGPRYFRISDVQ